MSPLARRSSIPPIREDAPNHERGLDSPDVVERVKLIPPGANYEYIRKATRSS